MTQTLSKKEHLQKELAKAQRQMAWALKSMDARRIHAMLDMAKSDLAIIPDQFDRNPWLLNCANGTVELTTGILREHRREDLITKLCPTPYLGPEAGAPVFHQFLRDIFEDDGILINYLQRLFGYALTGDIREQILPILWGVGANGKSTLINAISQTLGQDYVIKANRDLFMAKKADSHPAQMARLFGVRLVVCNESQDGARLDEAFVKELTGGDRIAARRMREDWWEFDPTHKCLLVTNHKPEIRGTDHAIWRRIRLIPFNTIFSEDRQDKLLPEKLKAEAPGILAWMVEGCRQWQAHGMSTPDIVLATTDEYRQEQDRLAQFIEEMCYVGTDYRADRKSLFAAYQQWLKDNGDRETNATAFGKAMTERGIKKDASKRWYLGITLQNVEHLKDLKETK